MEEVIMSLQSELGIDPLTACINNLEFGVNLNFNVDPNKLINCLFCYKWKPFNTMDNIVGQGNGKQCKGSNQYFVKIYNKGSQYYLPENILRIEKKVVTMVNLKFGKLKLVDLLNLDLWEHCKNELMSMIDEILFNEPLNTKSLTKIELKTYNKVLNQSTWINFSKDQRKRYKNAFNKIITTHGQGNYKQIILTLINDKFKELISK